MKNSQDYCDAKLITKNEYAKKLRPLLPPEAFAPDTSKVIVLLINLVILVLGWTIATKLDQWPVYLLWLYLPFAILMGHSIIIAGFSSHELLHGGMLRNRQLTYIIGLLGFAILWMPPTLWQNVHNKVHHNKTNSVDDPDRNYLYTQPQSWAKSVQNLCAPSRDVNPFLFTLGLATTWGFYSFRNIMSVLLFNNDAVSFVPASFKVTTKEYWTIWGEFCVLLTLHLSVLAYLEFDLVKIVLSYLLPIALGYAGVIFYICTNHLIAPMTAINDPLANSISVKVPQIFDLLHINFAYHTEHHIFPTLNSDYYPLVQQLLITHYPDKFNLLEIGEAWRLLLNTPRLYKDANNLTNWRGEISVPCLSKKTQNI